MHFDVNSKISGSCFLDTSSSWHLLTFLGILAVKLSSENFLLKQTSQTFHIFVDFETAGFDLDKHSKINASHVLLCISLRHFQLRFKYLI